MERLVIVSSRIDESVFPTREWIESEKGRSRCASCGTVNRSRFPEPFDMVLSAAPPHCVSDSFFRIKIYHREFINQISEYLRDFTLGKCVLSDGRILDDYVTQYSRRYILIRGNKHSKYVVCDNCGTVRPHGWYGRQYVLRSYLTESRIYQTPFNQLCIDEELAMQIDFSPWPDADLETIEIRDEPMDEQDPPYRAEP